jgi:hypothetical protein
VYPIYFGTTPALGLGLQNDDDLEEERINNKEEFWRVQRFQAKEAKSVEI